MKKSTKWQTVISLILILAVLAFGVIAYLTAQRNITSIVKINIPDNAVRIQLHGDATWVKDPSVAGKEYQSGEITSGSQNSWLLPNISWKYDEEQKKYPDAVLQIRIDNENHEVGLKITVKFSFDKYGSFSTKAHYKLPGNLDELNPDEIELSDPKYEFSIEKTTEYATLFVEYSLINENCSFDVGQTIEMTIEPEVTID